MGIPRSPHKIQTVTIEGRSYPAAAFGEVGHLPSFAAASAYHHSLALFLQDWFAPSPVLTVHTSGSTGAPKAMEVEKRRMIASADMTCTFLQLKRGDTALLCLPLDYIAGKMMVVRALVAGLDLYPVTPSGHPLEAVDRSFDLAAFVPLQVFNSLQTAEGRGRLASIRHLLIGGGAVDPQIEAELRAFPHAVYATYGMTETLSHIALRRINGKESSPYYTPFDSVKLSLSPEQTLCIRAPKVHRGTLYTNDVAELYPDGRFRICGRKDNVINSGGIKIQLEEVEKQLSPLFSSPFALTSVPDPRLGEKLVLVSESPVSFMDEIEKMLPPYSVPKEYLCIRRIPMTATGKVSRSALRELVQKQTDSSVS